MFGVYIRIAVLSILFAFIGLSLNSVAEGENPLEWLDDIDNIGDVLPL